MTSDRSYQAEPAQNLTMSNPNDPAFPIPNTGTDHAEGVTKREYFAALAMASLTSVSGMSKEYVARKAVESADALIDALNADP